MSKNAVAFLFACAVLACWSLAGVSLAQDSITLKSGGSRSKVSGKVSSMSPTEVVITSGGKSTDVPAGNIRKIEFGSEPSSLDKARERYDDGRFDDCLVELQKIDPPPAAGNILHEIECLKALATAQISLRGGAITAQNAGTAMVEFLRKYPDSYRWFTATELLGRLFEAVGRVDLAENEFTKMSQAEWPEYKTIGLFRLGNAQLKLKEYEKAKQNYSEIAQIDANDDVTIKYKQLALCQAAKTDALAGNTAAAQSTIEAMIKQENPDNKLLFAYLYNALGACYESVKDWQQAAIAYLHTELLFSEDPDANAEALKRLSEIWPKLGETDRANRAMTTLKNRYRNSYWANQ